MLLYQTFTTYLKKIEVIVIIRIEVDTVSIRIIIAIIRIGWVEAMHVLGDARSLRDPVLDVDRNVLSAELELQHRLTPVEAVSKVGDDVELLVANRQALHLVRHALYAVVARLK